MRKYGCENLWIRGGMTLAMMSRKLNLNQFFIQISEAVIIFVCLFFIFPPQQLAHPVWGEKVVLSQPDGKKIVGYIYGDEFYRRVETEEGYTLILNRETGYIEYALLKGKRLVPSGMAAGVVSPSYVEKTGLQKHLTDRPYRIAELREEKPEIFHDFGSWQRKETLFSAVQAVAGTRKVFVVCVDFQPESSPPTKWYQGEYSPSGFNDRIFSTDPNDISMANYYKANSYGQFYPVGYTHPTWVTVPHTASWYEENSSWRQIIQDAMDAIRAEDPSFDFTQYANNGEMDMIVIWAGTTQTWGDFYWPHKSGTSILKYGVWVRNYNAVNEKLSSGAENKGIGTFCHEYGHMTGCPDLYDYSSFNKVVGYYGIMGWSNPGTNFCGYLKWRNYGWIAPTEINNGGKFYVDALALETVSNPRLYRIIIDPPKEYLLVENRYNGAHPEYENYSGRWSGLLITHVDENYPPAVGQPSYPFYGLEAIVPVLDPSITMLSFYTSYFGKMVFFGEGGYSRLDPHFPDNKLPGSFLTLTYTDDDGKEQVEHVIYRNTQGHSAESDIYFIGISDSGPTMSFSVNVQTYAISGTVSPPIVLSGTGEKRGITRMISGKSGERRLVANSIGRRGRVRRLMVKAGKNVSAGVGGVLMDGLPGNPVTDLDGSYLGLVEEGWSGTVTPIKTHYTFVPQSRTYTNVTSDQQNQDFIALRNIYAPYFFEANQKLNRSLSQAEYINVLTWYPNPANENIVGYRIYVVETGDMTLLAELDAETKKYWHRKVDPDHHYKYAVAAVNDEGREGEYAYAEIYIP